MLDSLSDKIIDIGRNFFHLVSNFLFLLLMIFIFVSSIKSCFFSGTKPQTDNLRYLKESKTNEKHQLARRKLSEIIYGTTVTSEEDFQIFFVRESDKLNAASMGNGNFIVWESVLDQPEWAIDSILAHEVAHDELLHSRKYRDMEDFKNFFVEMFTIGSDQDTTEAAKELSSDLIIPQYNQGQEYEADSYAVLILDVLGYEKPEETYINMLRLIKSNYGESGGGFFDSHPSFDDREKKILAEFNSD